MNIVIAGVHCDHNNDEVYYTRANIDTSKSNNNNYEWIRWISSHFDHNNYPVVSVLISSQSIVWDVSLCDYQQWRFFILISDLEDCQRLRFEFHRY